MAAIDTKVTGLKEVTHDLDELGEDLSHLGGTLTDVARDTAASHRPKLARIEGAVASGGRAVVTYAGLIYPPAFGRTVVHDLAPRAMEALEHDVHQLIDERGLNA